MKVLFLNAIYDIIKQIERESFMRKFLKSVGLCAAGFGAILTFGAVNAAETGRAGYNTVGSTRAANVSTARMPTMPVLPINTIGNTSPDLPAKDNGDKPTPPPPTPTPDCPDGGVKNSTYTVENCMNDVLTCVNSGGLPHGLNDLFNEDVRNAVFTGMQLCNVQVEKCIATVRRDCKNVYRVSADVWLDFNSRKVQPEYYSFILRKTGLTPNQAENTCWLLDKNTYGSSFDAVANSGKTTAEYNVKVGAYNSAQNDSLTKANPQGVKVNNNNPGVDGQRGHYARWDATTGECLIRVAAYNKDTHIKNSWLFGAAGDDKPAEVWKNAGETFSCNKDLFGFGLLNKTSTTAVVGVGGGTLVGAGVGALAGHGARDFNCDIKSHRDELRDALTPARISILNSYLDAGSQITIGNTLSEPDCELIVGLYDEYAQAASCKTQRDFEVEIDVIEGGSEKITITGNMSEADKAKLIADMKQKNADMDEAKLKADINAAVDAALADIDCVAKFGLVHVKSASDVERLSFLNGIKILKDGQGGNIGTSALIGAGTGAAAGGLATAITAFVEKNNINCRVADGLERVGYGKSHTINTLKEFYVKWNLRLPDTIMPTPKVVDCTSWTAACATLTDLSECVAAQINYKPKDSNATVLIPSACVPSGSACLENHAVAVSYGACPQ